MTKKQDKLTQVSVKIGKTLGKANRRAHKVATVGVVAKQEIKEISRQIESLKKQLAKTSDRLKKVLVS
jgi:predicted translin family RNA/ssDNA-binding protein